MKTYNFQVVIEPDEDRWIAYCPVLEKYAAATWGYSKEEARRHIYEVIGMVIQELVEDKEAIPDDPVVDGSVFSDSRVEITV